MSSVKRKSLSHPVMVRMDNLMKAEILLLAQANGLSASDIIRLAVSHQLPSLRAGHTALKTTR